MTMTSKNKKNNLIKSIRRIIFILLLGYVAINIVFYVVSGQLQLNADMKKYDDLQERIAAEVMERDDLQRLKDEGLSDEYIKKIARELGYTDPNVRVYADAD